MATLVQHASVTVQSFLLEGGLLLSYIVLRCVSLSLLVWELYSLPYDFISRVNLNEVVSFHSLFVLVKFSSLQITYVLLSVLTSQQRNIVTAF